MVLTCCAQAGLWCAISYLGLWAAWFRALAPQERLWELLRMSGSPSSALSPLQTLLWAQLLPPGIATPKDAESSRTPPQTKILPQGPRAASLSTAGRSAVGCATPVPTADLCHAACSSLCSPWAPARASSALLTIISFSFSQSNPYNSPHPFLCSSNPHVRKSFQTPAFCHLLPQKPTLQGHTVHSDHHTTSSD